MTELLPKEYWIGRHRIWLPADHMLDCYQATHHRYDMALGYIAQFVFQKYPDSTAVDIGANVGDSAALIQKYLDVPVLCIEGNPEFVEYLEHNALEIGNIEIEACFVGDDGKVVDFEQILSQRGTASIVETVESTGIWYVEMKSLKTIIQSHPDAQNVKLLKTDTDGFDFFIIQHSADVVCKLRPVIHFEYDIAIKPDGSSEGLKTLQLLLDIGYQKFVVYDNFGNFLISLSAQTLLETFVDLNAYLLSNRLKSGRPSVYYFDICAFVEEDLNLFEQLRQLELEFSASI